MWIRDFVRRLGHTQIRDLMEVDLAIEYIDEERIETTLWRNVSIGSGYNRPTFAHVSGTSDYTRSADSLYVDTTMIVLHRDCHNSAIAVLRLDAP